MRDKFETPDIDVDQEEVLVDGARLTEAEVNAASNELERENARERAANLIPGGKSLSGHGSHSPVLQARVPAEVRARFDAIAERRGVRPSRLLREAIDQLIARHDAGQR